MVSETNKLEIKGLWWIVGMLGTMIFVLIGMVAANTNIKNVEQDQRLFDVEKENKTQGEVIAKMVARDEEVRRRLDSMDKKLDRLLEAR